MFRIPTLLVAATVLLFSSACAGSATIPSAGTSAKSDARVAQQPCSQAASVTSLSKNCNQDNSTPPPPPPNICGDQPCVVGHPGPCNGMNCQPVPIPNPCDMACQGPPPGRIVGRRAPEPGETCAGSTMSLGDNLPAQTPDASHEIEDIDAIWADNGTNTVEVVGWTYVTPSGMWVQENSSARGDFWQALAAALNPAVVSVLGRGGFAPESSNLWDTIKNYASSHNGHAASCFTTGLKVG